MSGFRGKRLIVALAAVGLLGAGAAVGVQGHGPRGAGSGDELGVMARLHDKLKLNEQQEALWKKARETSREAFKSMRSGSGSGSGQELREKMRAEIDKPGADLRSIMQLADQQREQVRAQMEAARKQVRDAWLGAYDALDASQKEQVRVAIKERMERGGHMGMRDGRGPMHEGGPGPQRDQGKS